MSMETSLIALIIFSLVFFGFILLMRFISYKEKMFLAEKGLRDFGPVHSTGQGKGFLISGIIVAMLGLALLLGLVPLGISSGYPLGMSPWLLFGLIPLFLGLGLVLIYFLMYANKAAPQAPKDTTEKKIDFPISESKTEE